MSGGARVSFRGGGGGCQKLQTRTDRSRVTTNIYLEPTWVLPPVRSRVFGSRLDNSQQKTHSTFFWSQKKRKEFYFKLLPLLLENLVNSCCRQQINARDQTASHCKYIYSQWSGGKEWLCAHERFNYRGFFLLKIGNRGSIIWEHPPPKIVLRSSFLLPCWRWCHVTFLFLFQTNISVILTTTKNVWVGVR